MASCTRCGAFFAGVDHRSHHLEISAEDFSYLLQRARQSIPFAVQLAQFNQLDSHDTPRFIHLLKGDKALLKVAVTMLMSYIGVPCLYYGDEIALDGAHDPDNRRPMPWDEALWDSDIKAHYQKLIKLRKALKVLQEGDILSLYAKGDVYVFARFLAGQRVIVAINRGAAAEVRLDLRLLDIDNATIHDLLAEGPYAEANQGRLNLKLAAKTALMLG
ncbi:MAG: alpha-amylase family glycosyl hydrolase [Deinococcales bacterium]